MWGEEAQAALGDLQEDVMGQSRWGLSCLGQEEKGVANTPTKRGWRGAPTSLIPACSDGRAAHGWAVPAVPRPQLWTGDSRNLSSPATTPGRVPIPAGMRAGPRMPPCARSAEQGRHRVGTAPLGAGGASYGPSPPVPAPSVPKTSWRSPRRVLVLNCPLSGSGVGHAVVTSPWHLAMTRGAPGPS